MTFLHCHNCGWEQDDFATEFYKPKGEMIYSSEEEFHEKNPKWICPKCGKPALDID